MYDEDCDDAARRQCQVCSERKAQFVCVRCRRLVCGECRVRARAASLTTGASEDQIDQFLASIQVRCRDCEEGA